MPNFSKQADTPDSEHLNELCEWLSEQSASLTGVEQWPAVQLQRCAEAGVFRWFIPARHGGFEWNPTEIAQGYIRLGASCLTTTFVITHWVASVKRILASDNQPLIERLIPDLRDGKSHTTVGISHLTTSRRHLANPVLMAKPTSDGFQLDGYCPWVTGAPFTDFILVGADMESGEQLLLVVPREATGVTVDPSQSLIALSASRTGSVRFDQVQIPASNVVAGPMTSVLASKANVGTGGLQTSTLALALADASINYVSSQAERRPELRDKAESLRRQWDVTRQDLNRMAAGNPVCSNEDLRTRANSLALRSSQAAMVAAKGAGFVEGHPVGRWCCEALFFLVWSCPPAVSEANLCELAGIQF